MLRVLRVVCWDCGLLVRWVQGLWVAVRWVQGLWVAVKWVQGLWVAGKMGSGCGLRGLWVPRFIDPREVFLHN